MGRGECSGNMPYALMRAVVTWVFTLVKSLNCMHEVNFTLQQIIAQESGFRKMGGWRCAWVAVG